MLDVEALDLACGGLAPGHWFRRAVQRAYTLPLDRELGHITARFWQLHPRERQILRERYYGLTGGFALPIVPPLRMGCAARAPVPPSAC